MGALESLLASSNATPPTPQPTSGGALEKLLAGSDSAGPAAPATSKPAAKGGSSNLVVDDLVGGTADAIDLVWTGLFAAPVAMAGEALTRAQLGANNLLGIGEPKTRRDIGRAGQATAARLNEKLGTPVRSTLKALGLLSDRPMAVEKAMQAAMSLVERDAASVEERTGGAIQKEDVLMGVNTLFGALGAKGVQYVAKSAPERAKAKAALKELAKIKEEGNARLAAADAEALNREAGGIPREALPGDNPAANDPNLPAFDQRVNAERKAYDLMQSGASKAKVEAIIKKDPAVGVALDAMMKRRAQASTFLQEAPEVPIREDGSFAPNAATSLLHRPSEIGPAEARARDAAAGIVRGPLGEPIFSAGPAALSAGTRGRSVPDPRRRPVTGSGLMGVEAPPQPDVFGAAAAGGKSVPDPRRPAGSSNLMGVPAQPTADPFGAAATGGRASPDPTRRPATGSGLEGLPIKRDSLGTPLSPNQTLAVVGATGLGLAAYYAAEGDTSDVAAAAAGGALLLGKGRGISLEAIRALPDTTTLREIRDASAYTLNTLENLPGNRAVHSKQAVSELLRRQEVTKAERDILQGVLDSVPGETITAKQLMAGVKEATGDFELAPKASGQYADYGLENIGRIARAPEDASAWIPENATPEEAARLEAEAQAEFARMPEATTNIYELPSSIDLSPLEKAIENVPGGHTYFKNSFGHARSFYEGGVKHVVELQNNQAQYATKALRTIPELTPEQLDAAKKALNGATTAQDVWKSVKFVVGRAGDYDFFAGLRKFKKEEARLTESVGHDDQTLMLEYRLHEALPRQAQIAYEADWRARHMNLGKDLPDDIPSHWDISGGVIDWILGRPELNTSALRNVLDDYASDNVNRSDVWIAEAKAKFGGSGADGPAAKAAYESIAPMWKDWHKRLVREELAASARKGEPTARFATADTVAKVEGWPQARRREVDQNVIDLRDELARVKELGYKPGEPWFDQVQTALTKAEEAQAKAPPAPRFSPEHQGIYDRYNKEVTAFLKQLGGKEVTDSAGHTWIEVPTEGTRKMPAGKRVQQFGAADPELVKTLGAVSGGVMVASLLSDDENKVRNAALAALGVSLAMFGRSRVTGLSEMAKTAVGGAERYLGTVSTRVGNMSPRLLRRMREHERGVLTRTNEYLQAIGPFVEGLRQVPESLRKELDAAILTGNPAKITAVLGRTGKPELVAQFRKARALLDKVGAELMQAGKLKGLLSDYYPRIVVDVPGLLKAIDAEERTFIEKQIAEASRRTMKEALRDLTPFEVSQIINKALKGAPRGNGRPGFLQGRVVKEVTPELAQFYAPASESLPLYLRAVSKELERARFFGENLVRDPVTGATHLDESIGNLVREEQLAGRLDGEQAMELGEILRSRFGPGERATSRPLQAAKNLAYAGLLGHVTSAITQLGDVAISAAAHGILPTLKAVQQNLTRKPARATVHDLGMIDHMAEEIVSASRTPVTVMGRHVSTAKFLEKAFKYSGFSWTDPVGKNVSIQASKNKLEGWAKTPAGIKRLQAEYGKAYTPAEMQQLVADLRSGELSELVKGVLFSELSDVQPISKLEVPQAYLDNPNGRVLYMLKTFMLKQADIVRREVYQNIKRGNYRKAMEQGTRFGLALGIGGASTQWINNWLLGRDQEPELTDIPLNALKTFGWSQHTLDKVRQGKPLEAAVDVAAPPYKMFDTIVSQDPAAMQYIPIVGRIYYARDWWDLLDESGSEKANRRLEREERRKEREE